MIFSIVLAGVFVFGALICYASCCAAARPREPTDRAKNILPLKSRKGKLKI